MLGPFDGTHLCSTVPPYPMPPFTYENNRMLFITFRTSPEVIRTLVPEPLAVNSDSLMSLYVGAFNLVAPEKMSYCEAGMMIPVSYGRKRGSYMPVLYLDQTAPITIGREIWGFPKFEAGLLVQVNAGIVHASVIKDGELLIDAALRLGEPITPGPLPIQSLFLMKTIPSAVARCAYDVRQLTTAVIRDGSNSEVRPGEATLHFGSTASDPLDLIPVLEIVSGVYTVGGFVLDYGEVLHDYLAEGPGSLGSVIS